MVERRSPPALPLIVTITIVIVCLSAAFWQWEQARSPLTFEAPGTVQSIEYVRSGASVNVPVLTLSYSDGADSFTVVYQSNSMPEIGVGDEVALRFDPSDPKSAVPAVEVASDISKRRSFAVFSALIGLIAALAAVASRIENASRLAPRHRASPPVAAG